MMRYILFFVLLYMYVCGLDKEKDYIKDKVFFTFGGEMIFLTMNSLEYNAYFKNSFELSNSEIKSDHDFVSGGGYVGAGYVFLNRMSFGGFLGVYSLPGVDINHDDSTFLVVLSQGYTHVKRNYITVSHEYEIYTLPYRKYRFNFSFFLLTGVGFAIDSITKKLNDSFVGGSTRFGGTSFVLSPGFRFHVRMNEKGDFQFGYKQMLAINNQLYHFGTIAIGLVYNFDFKRKEEIDDNKHKKTQEILRKNI